MGNSGVDVAPRREFQEEKGQQEGHAVNLRTERKEEEKTSKHLDFSLVLLSGSLPDEL